MQNKDLIQVSRKKPNPLEYKWLEQFFQEQMTNRNMKRCPTLPITRETEVWLFQTFNKIAGARTVFKRTKQQTENNKYCSLAHTMWKTWLIIVCYIYECANK